MWRARWIKVAEDIYRRVCDAMVTEGIAVKNDFSRDLVLELVRTAVRENINAAPSRAVATGIVFREVLARIDFNTHVVKTTEYDVGPIGPGVINVAALALEFGHFLASQGFDAAESYVLPEDQ